MNRFKHVIATLAREESGQDLIEYALVAALVGLGSIAALRFLAAAITNTFVYIGSVLMQNA